jgi:hypothetical protein
MEEVLFEQEGNASGDEERDLAEMQELDTLKLDANGGAESPDQAAHNESVAKSLQAKAIAQMKERGVEIPEQQSKDAIKIIPKVHLYFLSMSSFSLKYCRSRAWLVNYVITHRLVRHSRH